MDDAKQYEFTSDWFSVHIPAWERWMSMLPERKRFLEIGSYEGRSTCWMIEKGIQGDYGYILCIDPWIGNGEHAPPGVPIDDKYERFLKNTDLAQVHRLDLDRTVVNVVTQKRDSFTALADIVGGFPHRDSYDFIYVDGSHLAKYCLADCILAWPLLKEGGIMVMDDYIWGSGANANESPKWAIDTFTSMWGGELDIIGMGNQVAVRKRVRE